ncbi:MAG: hypothetical protein E5V67_01900 [Mesorhizobium sp.]|uniref:hypothetical protein n=1 Tax=unclassified Mesorhizobium TaxID=325217 RepID=UPI000FD70668|nr:MULTISPECIES: hypothetical protein [unclassified Mesorhizobium]TGQ20026.1 hypothetical protein EN860_014855 [Mesorhizobium sp. M00.F.Ca.ET.217.01.1.1]TGS69156.1 hypothetical protein EN844_09825 [Mesorhizobium sp. M3A.F.Ca.ET.201.01.1.1]TGV94521.1 hypothetical protein EN801_002505 [Mesorhizobium sp. M00.F.Ca.ET.158.01.1.1]TKB44467.1 MAG: hypothetical protein E5V67_01900 [Mesorhizobium sp.]
MGASSRFCLASRASRTVLAAIIVALPRVAFADSNFRGFSISDTFEQVQQKAKADGYEIKVLPPVVATDDDQNHLFLKLKGETCASMVFGIKQSITQMDLYPCFYNGKELALQQVVSEFVDRFGGQPEADVYQGSNCTNAEPLIYRGNTKEGELYEIFQDCVVAIRIKPGSKVQF